MLEALPLPARISHCSIIVNYGDDVKSEMAANLVVAQRDAECTFTPPREFLSDSCSDRDECGFRTPTSGLPRGRCQSASSPSATRQRNGLDRG